MIHSLEDAMEANIKVYRSSPNITGGAQNALTEKLDNNLSWIVTV